MRAVGLGRPPPAVPATARAEPAGTGGTRQHGRCGRTVSVSQAEWSTRRRRASLRSDRRCWSPVPSFQLVDEPLTRSGNDRSWAARCHRRQRPSSMRA